MKIAELSYGGETTKQHYANSFTRLLIKIVLARNNNTVNKFSQAIFSTIVMPNLTPYDTKILSKAKIITNPFIP